MPWKMALDAHSDDDDANDDEDEDDVDDDEDDDVDDDDDDDDDTDTSGRPKLHCTSQIANTLRSSTAPPRPPLVALGRHRGVRSPEHH